MASKHGSPKKRDKEFQGITPRGRITPLALPRTEEGREKQRTGLYVMAEKLRAGEGFFGVLQVLGLRLNIGKRLLEQHFTDEDQHGKVVEALSVLVQVKHRMDQARAKWVGASDIEVDAIKLALNVVDAVEDTVTPLEFQAAARYVGNALNSGANLVKH